jgi:hypothetical protein
MESQDVQRLEAALGRLERHNGRLSRGLCVAVGLWLVTVSAVVLIGAGPARRAAPAVDPGAVLRVRGLVVADSHGVDRVWIGAPLPDPPVLGKRYRRQGEMAGILIFDADGNERGGYITTEAEGQAMLTLDNITGDAVHLVAYPEAGAALGLMDLNSGVEASLSVMPAGPKLKLSRGQEVVFQRPEAAEGKP